ncbi:integral membrane protein DUF106-domain-containing protein [Phakopsora pachyrhizi]|uniref:ER membrane protein complex subunit 3 n=1 Tax=Phakopsora pachyrhizi TaxID=170000 RepID=A0AAV0B1L4_PHAPC|nr:integral membrane protein DUF106-domain-containing protein [Phakopsora pachyrhizi]
MSTWAEQDIRLDPAIRNWVLLPITIVMLLVGILRHYAIQLLNSPTTTSAKPNKDSVEPTTSGLKKLREQRILVRSNLFRLNSNFLNHKRFRSRRESLMRVLDSGDYLSDSSVVKVGGEDGTPPNPMDLNQMDGMMDGLKKQMVMMVPQTVIMGWINTFFFGFVCVKLPFPLPNGFKQMIQRGIETPDMDISWVSSLSWYFLNLFGLNPIYRIILGDGNAADGSSALSMGSNSFGVQQPATNLPGQQLDYKKLFKAEIENLKLLEYNYFGDSIPSNSRNGNGLNGSYQFIKNERNQLGITNEDDEIGEDIESRVILIYGQRKKLFKK